MPQGNILMTLGYGVSEYDQFEHWLSGTTPNPRQFKGLTKTTKFAVPFEESYSLAPFLTSSANLHLD